MGVGLEDGEVRSECGVASKFPYKNIHALSASSKSEGSVLSSFQKWYQHGNYRRVCRVPDAMFFHRWSRSSSLDRTGGESSNRECQEPMITLLCGATTNTSLHQSCFKLVTQYK